MNKQTKFINHKFLQGSTATRTKMGKDFVQQYLDRLEYKGDVTPTLDNLKAICWAHVTHVPFFTLDMFGGKRKTVNLEDIKKKILENKFGGMCYEVNGLFHELLKALGFNVKIFKGKIEDLDDKLSPFGHLGLIVEFEDYGKFITDCAVLAGPLPLQVGTQHNLSSGTYRIEEITFDDGLKYISLNKMNRIPMNYDEEIEPVITEDEISSITWMQKYFFREEDAGKTLDNFKEDIDLFQDLQGEYTVSSFCGRQVPGGVDMLIGNTLLQKLCCGNYHERKKNTKIEDKDLKQFLKNKFDVQLDFDVKVKIIRKDLL